MYFSAIGFIYDVKKGPFWEHSPMLYDISGIQAGWGKINKVSLVALAGNDQLLIIQGMIKMYNAEVLSKFPVVQHFPFGSLFSWDRDPNAVPPPTSAHMSTTQSQSRGPAVPSAGQTPPSGTRAPWATATQAAPPAGAGTAAPWAAKRDGCTPGEPPTSLPDTSRLPPGPMAPTRAPWAASSTGQAPGGDPTHVPTKAPWAK